MLGAHIPGVSLVVIDGGRLIHSAGFGWADITTRRAMTPETVQNIGSITKTITCTAVMQLWEQGRCSLDDAIDKYLSFNVRNPAWPDRAITIRELLVHTSSIADGPAYRGSYACGDSKTNMGDWLQEYFRTDGRHYDAQLNFHSWEPGSQFRYSNVAYGLLGLLIERLSGLSYPEYCAKHIFEPLQMQNSGFLLSQIDLAVHARTYSHVTRDKLRDVRVSDPTWPVPEQGDAVTIRHCLYSFATMPDGLARTSASALSRLLLAYLRGGELDGARILRASTVAEIFNEQRLQATRQPESKLGITWWRSEDGTWGHGGGDPGITTSMKLRQRDGRGVVLFANGYGAMPMFDRLMGRIFGFMPA